MQWGFDVDACDLSELTKSAFVNFVREKVTAWFEWRAEKAEHLKMLIQKYDGMETELAEVDARLCEFCTQDEEELIDDVLPPAEQKLEDQADELEDDLEELMGSIQQIRCDPNLVPTCGFDLIGRPVMLSDLTLESKCMLLALWFRRDHRSLALLPEVVANELGQHEQGYLKRWLEDLDLIESPVHHKSCVENQFQTIKLITTEILSVYQETQPPAREAISIRSDVGHSDNSNKSDTDAQTADLEPGVSFFDAMIFLDGDGDTQAATEEVKRFSKSTHEKPRIIGKCPYEGRRSLHCIRDVVRCLKIFYGLDKQETRDLTAHLNTKKRLPRETSSN